jgi:hypothetical protein
VGSLFDAIFLEIPISGYLYYETKSFNQSKNQEGS